MNKTYYRFSAVCLVPLALFQREKTHLRRKARTQEW